MKGFNFFVIMMIICQIYCLLEYVDIEYDPSNSTHLQLSKFGMQTMLEKYNDNEPHFLSLSYKNDLSEHYALVYSIIEKDTNDVKLISVHLHRFIYPDKTKIKLNSVGTMLKNKLLLIHEPDFIILQQLILEYMLKMKKIAILDYIKNIIVYGWFYVIYLHAFQKEFVFILHLSKITRKFNILHFYSYISNKEYIS